MSKKTITIDENVFSIGGSKARKRKSSSKKTPSSPVNPKYKKDLLSKIKKALNKSQTSQTDKASKVPIKKMLNPNSNDNAMDYFASLKEKRQSKLDSIALLREQNYTKIEPHINDSGDTQPTDLKPLSIINDDSRPQLPSPQLPSPPYGNLKNGKKPTYRTWKKHQSSHKHNETRRKYHSHKPTGFGNVANKPLMSFSPSSGENKLMKIRDRLNSTSTTIQEPILNNQSLSTTVKIVKKTLKKTVALGKNKNTHTIGTILTSEKRRMDIKKGINELLNKPINDIKRYLKEKNIIRSGSLAPNVLMRHLYIQNYLSGGGVNVNKNAIIDNYKATTI